MCSLAIVVVGLVFVASAGVQAQPSAADEAAVRAVLDQLPALWSKTDSKGLAALYAADADYVSSTGRTAKGTAAIEKLFADQFAGVYKGTSIKTQTSSVRFVKSDVAITDGTFEMTGLRGPDGKEMVRKGNITYVAVKQGGQWKITALRAMVPSMPARPIS